MKIKLKDRVANLYHKQQGIPRAGHVSLPVSIVDAMQDCTHSGWLLKVGFSVRTWKKRFFVLTDTALFYYKTDKSPRQQGEILLSQITDISEVKDDSHKPFSISISTYNRTFCIVGNDEADAKKWMDALNAKTGHKGMDVVIDHESFPPMCQEAEVIANQLTQMKNTLLASYGDGSSTIQRQMLVLQEKFELFEREYGYIAQVQVLAVEMREFLENCSDRLIALQAEEEAQFQATKIKSKAQWLKDAIDVGDPEQLARHIQEMTLAFIPFKEKYGVVTPVRAVVPMIREFDALLVKANAALKLIDYNLDKLDGIDIIVGKITWLSDAIERGTIQDLEKHIQEMKEILSAFVEKHGQDQNALPIELLEKAQRRLAKLQQLNDDDSLSSSALELTSSSQLRQSSPISCSSLASSVSSVVILDDDAVEAKLHAQRSTENSPAIVRKALQRSTGSPAQTRTQTQAQQAQSTQPPAQEGSELRDSDGGTGSGLLGTAVYCSMKHTGKAGSLQKYVVCITCENYDATICLSCRDVCHAGHDVTYEREAECACYCGMGAFSSPCACFATPVTRKSSAEIAEIHNQVTEARQAKTVVNIINEISMFPNPNPPTGWSDTTRDPCGLIFAHSSRKDQGLTSELHKTHNMKVVFAKKAILKGMGEEVLQNSFTDDDPIYGRVFLPAAPSRIPVAAFPGEEVGYSKVTCYTGLVLYVDGRLWLPPVTPSPISASSSLSFPLPFTLLSPIIPVSPRRKYSGPNHASIVQSNSHSFCGPFNSPSLISSPVLPLSSHSSGISRRAHNMGHVRSHSSAAPPSLSLAALASLPPLAPPSTNSSSTSSSTETAAEAAAIASVSAVAAAAASPAVATAVARKSVSRRDSINRIRRYSYNAAITSGTTTTTTINGNNQTSPATSPPMQCSCNNTHSCAFCVSPATSPVLNVSPTNTTTTTTTPTTTSTLTTATTTTTTTTTNSPIIPLLSNLHYGTRPHRAHTRTNSNVIPSGPVIGGGEVLSPELTLNNLDIKDRSERLGGLVTSFSASHVGLSSLYDSTSGLGLGLGERISMTPEHLSPVTPPNHFFELSMVSGEPQWEWTTYRLMLHNSPGDPDVKLYQTQISNWQKVITDLTPGTHKIRMEIALGPNPPIRYCVAYGEFEITEAYANKVKKAELEAMRAMIVKEWKDKYTYGTVESNTVGKWVYQMDGSLKCRDGPYTGAEYYWTGDKLEKRSGGLDCVYECYWHPNKHPPELDVHFLPELSSCGFTISHPGVTVSGSVPPPLVTLLAELRFIDREYRQSRAEFEYKLAQKKKYDEVKGNLIGKVCSTCNTSQNWLICTKCFVDFCGCYTSIDPHCPVCNCIDNLASFSEDFPT